MTSFGGYDFGTNSPFNTPFNVDAGFTGPVDGFTGNSFADFEITPSQTPVTPAPIYGQAGYAQPQGGFMQQQSPGWLNTLGDIASVIGPVANVADAGVRAYRGLPPRLAGYGLGEAALGSNSLQEQISALDDRMKELAEMFQKDPRLTGAASVSDEEMPSDEESVISSETDIPLSIPVEPYQIGDQVGSIPTDQPAPLTPSVAAPIELPQGMTAQDLKNMGMGVFTDGQGRVTGYIMPDGTKIGGP